MKNGGWRALPQFADFRMAVEGVPIATKGNAANRQYFENLPETFIGIFEKNLQKHIYNRWLGNDLISYMIGGEPELSKVLAKMLDHYKTQTEGVSVNDDGETINNNVTPFTYTSDILTTIELGAHHVMFEEDAEAITLDTKEAMKFLTTDVKWAKVLDDVFVQRNWELIEKMARADETVRLFDLHEDGKSSSFIIPFITSISSSQPSFSFRLLSITKVQSTKTLGLAWTMSHYWKTFGDPFKSILIINSVVRTTYKWQH